MSAASLSIQFHATHRELAQFVARWASELGLWLAVESFGPSYSAQEIDENALSNFGIPAGTDRIVLSTAPLRLEPTDAPMGLLEHNHSCLTLLVGKESRKELGESMLQAGSDDEAVLLKWKPIRRDLLSALRRGGRVVNTATGAVAGLKNHYYSAGAKAMFDRGAVISGLAPLLRYELVE